MQLSVTRCLSLDAALTTGVRAVVYAGGTAPSAPAGITPGTVVETSDYLPFGTRWTQTGGNLTATLTDPSNPLEVLRQGRTGLSTYTDPTGILLAA